MKMKDIYISMIILIIISICFGCSENSTKPEEEIPLDGRGGGVLAYCYQPVSGTNTKKEIYAINADGTGNTKISDAQIGLNHHDWSPDAQKITAVGYVNNTTWSIYVFNAADGSNLTRLTNTTGVWDSEPVWSPGGAQIAFTRIYPNQNNREELWIMDADGSNSSYIGIEGFAAKWSSDGTKFIYSSKSTGNYEIYTCQINGTDVQKLTNTNIEEWFPIWSPDDNQIAYNAYPSGDYNSSKIYIMDANGDNLRRLTNNNVSESYPRWSPDGSLIAFHSGPLEEWEVYIINSDGTNLRRVTNSSTGITAINPAWRPGN